MGEEFHLDLEFKKGGWRAGAANVVEASIPVREGSDKHWNIQGKWCSQVSAFNEETGETLELMKAGDLVENETAQYCFNKFTLQLNDISETYKRRLPKTDTRLRPDQRAYEHGDVELATSEKHRLEEKQRAARKHREKDGAAYAPRYLQMQQDPETGEEMYQLVRDYWKDRATGDYGE